MAGNEIESGLPIMLKWTNPHVLAQAETRKQKHERIPHPVLDPRLEGTDNPIKCRRI
jgi:hypothetical protein